MLLFLALIGLSWTQEVRVLTPEELSAYAHRVPREFVDLEKMIPSIQLQIRYHDSDNCTGAPLPGYAVPKAWMLPEAAEALAKVQEELSWEDLGLLVYDAYRPRRASEAMVAWAKRTNQQELIDNGYISARSGHNHGHTIDVTIVDLKTGQPLDMGGEWEAFDDTSYVDNATGIAAQNRQKLQSVMQKHGFRSYSKKWWHFRYPMVGTTGRDVPYSCFESKEWKFQPPSGWDQPGYVSPPKAMFMMGEIHCLSSF